MAGIKKNYAGSVAKGRFSQEVMDQRMALISTQLTYDGFDTVDLIIENLHQNAAQAKAILADLVPRIPKAPNWPCHSALRNAIMTDRKFWPAKTVKELRLLIEKYL